MELAAVILAAGKGTRMKSDLPKVLHAIAGRSMVGHVLDTLDKLAPARTAVVIGPGMESVAEAVAPVPAVVQAEQLGTADAVKAAREVLAGAKGTVLVLYGDTPFISAETLQKMVVARQAEPAPAVVVLGFRPADPGAYGRLMLDPDREGSRRSSRRAMPAPSSCRSTCAIRASWRLTRHCSGTSSTRWATTTPRASTT